MNIYFLSRTSVIYLEDAEICYTLSTSSVGSMAWMDRAVKVVACNRSLSVVSA